MDETDEQPPAIGIDLGTTYSCVGVVLHGKVEIIANELGFLTTPSYIGFTDTDRLVGEAAKNQAGRNPTNTIFDVKRIIGRKYYENSVQEDIKMWPFRVVNDNSVPKVEVEINGKKQVFCAEQLSAMILTRLKEIAERYLNQTVSDAVITVPAYFNNSQREATKIAGSIAGLNVLRIQNEPTAAAIAYGWLNKDKNSEGEKKILVYDLGGGTFDVSILTLENNSYEVKATAGNTHLGGEDFDYRIINYFVKEIEQKFRVDIRNNKRAMRRLRTYCEHAKRILSSATEAVIEIDALFDGIDFVSRITRAKFEELTAELFKSTLVPVKQALVDAEMKKEEIDIVILVGGSTRIPKIQKILNDFFNGQKQLTRSLNPDEAIAYGAAIQAAYLRNERSVKAFGMLLHDVTPLSLGINEMGGRMAIIVRRNTQIPVTKTEMFKTAIDNQSAVDIEVFQGESTLTYNNHLLGKFSLEDIPPAPAGTHKIQVSFMIDADGVLNVMATNQTNPNSQKSMTIKNTSVQFSNNQIQRMIAESEKYLLEKRKKEEITGARKNLEELCYKIGDELDAEYELEHGKLMLKFECDDAIEWLVKNPSASKEDYQKRFEKLKKFMTNCTDPLFFDV